MNPIVTSLYDTAQEADWALRSLRAKVSLAHADVYDGSPGSLHALDRLDLTREERHACEDKLATGAYMLLALANDGEDPDRIVAVLETVADEQEPASAPATRHNQVAANLAAAGVRPIAEERLPIIEEELRIGTQEVVRGGVKVRTRIEEVPLIKDVELREEFVRVDRRSANRWLTEQELAEAGLLKERTVEIAQVREEAVVTKEAFVREEVIVSKTIERRVEHIRETVRRTEVETEDLGGDPAGLNR